MAPDILKVRTNLNLRMDRWFVKRDNIVTIRADFQQGMESVLKMNTVTENDWLIYAAAMVI